MRVDLAHPPPVDPAWLADFMSRFRRLEPQVTAIMAIEHAVLAFRSAWLLEPHEAAELWISSVRHQGWSPPPG